MIYPEISGFQRRLLGWMPVSVGDLLYAIVAFQLLRNIYQWFKMLFKGKGKWAHLKIGLISTLNFGLILYLFFYMAWGLNYSREKMSTRFGFQYRPAKKNDLISFNRHLIDQANDDKQLIDSLHLVPLTGQELTDKAIASYQKIKPAFTMINEDGISSKPSLFGFVGDYLGFTGYYNPFTGEAQYNTGAPLLELPFVCCHEMAHQMGFAKENEANFAGYLAASQSDDPRFRYAATLEMYHYAHRQLSAIDSAQARLLNNTLSMPVKNDMELIRQHNLRYENAIEPYINQLYSLFLMSNRQPEGIKTYGDVVSQVISYRKSRGLPF